MPIEDGIKIVVKEAYEPTGVYNAAVKPHIQLLMQTKDAFPCLGYQTVNDLNRKGADLNIKIYGVKEPNGVCVAAVGPTTAEYKLNLNSGKYHFYFTYKKTENIQLTVTEKSLTVTAEKTTFIEPRTKIFWRYPEKSLAYLCSSYSTEAKKRCRLERTLKSSISLKLFTFPR